MIFRLKKAFTLIELLIVIGIMAVIAAGVVALIDPVEKTRQANDANVQNAIGQIATALQSYAAQQPTGTYPAALADLVTFGELSALPVLPNGYSYGYTVNGASTTAEVHIAVMSKKYTTAKCGVGGLPAGPSYWVYSTGNGRACGHCSAGTVPTLGATVACHY